MFEFCPAFDKKFALDRSQFNIRLRLSHTLASTKLNCIGRQAACCEYAHTVASI